jgi:hypothetical protein
MDIAYPYEIDPRGFTETADEDAHIRQMIEQILFTLPGERVNRPDFGCGIQRAVFAGSPELAATLQGSVHESLQRWLGHRIQIEAVDVGVEEATVTVSIRYLVVRTGERNQHMFRR